jgi:hypothetical protein
MKKSRFSETQIVAILKEADAGMKVVEVTRTGPIEKLVWAPTKDPENER